MDIRPKENNPDRHVAVIDTGDQAFDISLWVRNPWIASRLRRNASQFTPAGAPITMEGSTNLFGRFVLAVEQTGQAIFERHDIRDPDALVSNARQARAYLEELGVIGAPEVTSSSGTEAYQVPEPAPDPEV